MVNFINNFHTATNQVTVMILGCGRGGTSAVAGMLRELGIGFPEQTHPLKHESSPVVYDGKQIDAARTMDSIRQLDGQYDVWGWKSPRDIFTIHSWVSMIRNPAFVVVFRHPVDTIESVAKYESVSFEIAAKHVGEVNAELSRFILMTPFPVAVLSYEELCAKPWSIIPEIVGWLGLSPSYDSFQSACGFVGGIDRQYRSLTRQRGPGAAEFSAQEIERDRTFAQREMYGQAAAELNAGIEELAADCLKAQDIVLHLERQLTNELGQCVTRPTFNTADDPDELFFAPTSSLAAYKATRERFAKTSMRRLRLQQRIAALTELAASIPVPEGE